MHLASVVNGVPRKLITALAVDQKVRTACAAELPHTFTRRLKALARWTLCPSELLGFDDDVGREGGAMRFPAHVAVTMHGVEVFAGDRESMRATQTAANKAHELTRYTIYHAG